MWWKLSLGPLSLRTWVQIFLHVSASNVTPRHPPPLLSVYKDDRWSACASCWSKPTLSNDEWRRGSALSFWTSTKSPTDSERTLHTARQWVPRRASGAQTAPCIVRKSSAGLFCVPVFTSATTSENSGTATKILSASAPCWLRGSPASTVLKGARRTSVSAASAPNHSASASLSTCPLRLCSFRKPVPACPCTRVSCSAASRADSISSTISHQRDSSFQLLSRSWS
mmetsp:Transcript_117844/g.334115  ORF Transcript_117844/g.334115 Transcript_117844/m.334115 type:complete len:226 (+) Transcript_117844:335-1012(+)